MTDTNETGRYMAFAWYLDEAQGGSGDVVGRFGSVEDAVAAAKRKRPNGCFCEVLDLETGRWAE